MRVSKWFVCVLLPAACIAGNPALADNCSGRGTTVILSSETLEVAKGHSVTFYASRSSVESENALYNLVGECGGYALAMPDGKVKEAGVCARKGKEGDSWTVEYAKEPGAERGTWKMVDGTGAFLERKASGWWQYGINDGKTYLYTWGGTCE